MTAGKYLLQAMEAAIRGGHVDWQALTQQEWQELTALARQQYVLPLLVEVVWPCSAFRALPQPLQQQARAEARRQIVAQTMRTQMLLALSQKMAAADLHPLVMKGVLCRGIYSNPDARPSSDEDLLVPQEEFSAAADFLTGLGCRRMGKEDCGQAFEVGFITPEGLHIELHCRPFAPELGALSGANEWFAAAHQRAVTYPVGEGTVNGMNPHDHMLYLILHAFKHLIHRGFGLRQVCDILLWGEHYRTEIDWDELERQCAALRAWGFARAVFAIGREQFGVELPGSAEDGGMGEALLKDLLAGGVFGGEEPGRMHSATITLSAVESDRKGERTSLSRTLFPSRSSMEGKYPYLRKYPFLLPVAWLQRILRYGAQPKAEGERAADSLRIGRERTELLRKLDVID